jgi:SAM-dependent methyltransferase
MNYKKFKNGLSISVKRELRKIGLISSFTPSIGNVSFGDLDRVTPISKEFGFDRGDAIDRYYIENFLKKEENLIFGKTLEIGDNAYTHLYGNKKVTSSDILHVDKSNKNATIIGDISDAPHIPDNFFDCIILTQTLQFIYDFKGALHTCYRILKKDGTLLLTVPGITAIDHGEWNSVWYWSFTDKSLTLLLQETFYKGYFDIQTYGNVFVATSFLYGLSLQEISKEKLDYRDNHFPVIITAKAVKQ